MENWEQKYLVERQAHSETANKCAAIILRLTRKVASLHLWLALTTVSTLVVSVALLLVNHGSR